MFGAQILRDLRSPIVVGLAIPISLTIALGLLYFSRYFGIEGGVKLNLMSLGGKEGLLALGQGLGRALLPWLAALMLAEWASKRRHAGVLVTPLVTSALLFRGGEWMGVWESSSRLVFDVVGLLGCWYLGHRARSAAVDPAPPADEVNSPSGEEPAVTLEVVDDGGTGAARGRTRARA